MDQKKSWRSVDDKELNRNFILDVIYHLRIQGKSEILPTDVENITDILKKKDKVRELLSHNSRIILVSESECKHQRK